MTNVVEPSSPLRPLACYSPAANPTRRREASFFNPMLVTPTLTPGPGNEVSAVPLGAAPGPWIVSPPPPSGVAQHNSGFFSSPGGWFHDTLRRDGPKATALAAFFGAVLFFVVLGAYIVLIYLAITTRKTKYIIFLCVLVALMFIIFLNLHSSQQPVNPNRPARFLTEEEENAAIKRAYGKQVPA